MDLIFQYELANLQTIAKADRGEISDRDIQVEFATASLQMKAQVAQRDAAAAAEQRAAQAEAEREGKAQAATEARAGRNAIMQFLLANKPFQLPPSPPNLASSPTINCTTNYAGSAAYTNCR
jgi:hypothetical protein